MNDKNERYDKMNDKDERYDNMGGTRSATPENGEPSLPVDTIVEVRFMSPGRLSKRRGECDVETILSPIS